MPQKIKSAYVIGIRLDEVNWGTLTDICREYLSGDKYNYIVTLNGEIALLALKNSRLKSAINTASLVIPDSTNIRWAGHRRKLRLPDQTAGSDLIHVLCKLAVETNKSIFLLGARGDTARRAGEKLAEIHPGLKVVGTSNANPEDKGIISKLIHLKPDILVIAYGSPKQEIWMNDHRRLPIKIAVGLGGTLDMIAGDLPRAPKLMRRFHLEWLWRFFLQPSRFKRIYRATVVFPLKFLTTR